MSDLPFHHPAALDTPLPGPQWFDSCAEPDADSGLVGENGVCSNCGGNACPLCGYDVQAGDVCGCPPPMTASELLASNGLSQGATGSPVKGSGFGPDALGYRCPVCGVRETQECARRICTEPLRISGDLTTAELGSAPDSIPKAAA